jgi:hypothetical protein
MADRLQEVVYDLLNMADGAGTYPFILARELDEIATELDKAWDGNDR